MEKLLETFCFVDDVCAMTDAWLLQEGLILGGIGPKRGPKPMLSTSEVVTLMILFHQSNYRHFKAFYLQHVCTYLRSEFPRLPSYTRLVAMKKQVLVHQWAVVQMLLGQQTGVTFLDSTPLRVCHIRRENQHRVFDGFAKKGKTSTGWFFGFKLHLCINDKGELLSFWLTSGNEHDTVCVERLTQGILGKLYGDKGYISQKLTQTLAERGLKLVTNLRSNMKPKVMKSLDALMLRKRAVIESVIDQLKNISQIEHSRHRSPMNWLLNVFAALGAYCLQPKKPSLNLHQNHETVLL